MLEFNFNNEVLRFEPESLLIAGYTAKDQEALIAHIEELKEIGVAAPNQVPMVYDLSPELLTTKKSMSTVKNDTSGEVEVVLLDIDGEWYVALGSDHTDRKLEAVSVHKSKQVCAKPISSNVWKLSEIEEHWDEIELRSWFIQDGKETLYQTGKLAAFLSPKELLAIMKERGYPTKKIALFCGTPPLLTDSFIYAEGFRAELIDTKNNKVIELKYDVNILIDAKED